MIVPAFWAEARAQRREQNRQVTVRRFGWSDESLTAAQAHAETRAAEALLRIWSGDKKLLRREPKIAYNGAHGVPIREEIIARQGDAIVTRNGYGAHCLNTPNCTVSLNSKRLHVRFRATRAKRQAACDGAGETKAHAGD